MTKTRIFERADTVAIRSERGEALCESLQLAAVNRGSPDPYDADNPAHTAAGTCDRQKVTR